ncbi:MAG: transposase, partial [Rhabdochlamydiaceae bacterium]
KERSTMEELARKYELHPNQINQWKKEVMSKWSLVLDKQRSENGDSEAEVEKLYAQIGQLKVENNFLKKSCFKTGGRTTSDGGQRREFFEYKAAMPAIRYPA